MTIPQTIQLQLEQPIAIEMGEHMHALVPTSSHLELFPLPLFIPANNDNQSALFTFTAFFSQVYKESADSRKDLTELLREQQGITKKNLQVIEDFAKTMLRVEENRYHPSAQLLERAPCKKPMASLPQPPKMHNLVPLVRISVVRLLILGFSSENADWSFLPIYKQDMQEEIPKKWSLVFYPKSGFKNIKCICQLAKTKFTPKWTDVHSYLSFLAEEARMNPSLADYEVANRFRSETKKVTLQSRKKNEAPTDAAVSDAARKAMVFISPRVISKREKIGI